MTKTQNPLGKSKFEKKFRVVISNIIQDIGTTDPKWNSTEKKGV